jgi:hypothetical protein
MLETPKTETTIDVKMSSDVTTDNEQAIAMVACLYVGEGHFTMGRAKNGRNGSSIKIEVGFTNSEATLIDFICSWLTNYGIAHFIRECTGTKRPCYQVVIQRLGPIIRLVNLIEPFMLGEKKAQARILRRFCMRRLEKKNVGANSVRKYDEIDESMLQTRNSLRESSEAIRIPNCAIVHKTIGQFEDMVHPQRESL